MSKLIVENLSFSYQPAKGDILTNVSLTLSPGSFNLLVGPSGSGKSTLLKLMAGLYPQFGGTITSGAVQLEGQPIGPIVPFERAKHVALLFQNPSRQFAMQTPVEQLRFALENIQFPVEQISDRIAFALSSLAIEHLAHQNLFTMSGGEQQKIALATVLALDSQIILLDEPFANVDPSARLDLLQLLKTLQVQHGKTILIADHDLSGYAGLVDHMYTMQNTNVESADVATLNQAPVSIKFNSLNRTATVNLSWQALTITLGQRQLLTPSTMGLPVGQLGLLSGVNGAGKTTLFKALAHQLPYTGQVMWQGLDSKPIKAKQWAQTLGYVFQSATDQFVAMTVADELAISQRASLLSAYWTDERILSALETLNLTGAQDQIVYQLSGGQQKKVQVLSMLIMGQPVLLLDEPLAGLDMVSLTNLMPLIKQTITDNKLTGLMISHQRNGLAPFIDYELTLANQQLLTNQEVAFDAQ
ncbi:MAG: energy-coupling factor ABC transporter ATP-binding protein [Lactobacillaceae bacterium]|jgi:energy-coupling factor transport system ATP-binding protein|nr:energy-coupling factor ABC transporter ATP-binding protein [Lactobacillaceae bacterium]